MKQLTDDKYSLIQVMMTLSAIAYTPTASLSNLQESLNAAAGLQHRQIAIWLANDDGCFIFLVKSKDKEEYTIAIKGPVFPFDLSLLFNFYENMGVAHQVILPDCKQVKVAAGILKIIQQINERSFEGKTLRQLLTHLPRGARLYITGHSIGGSLAAAYSAQLASRNQAGLNIVPYIFAAPAIGNEPFAKLFDPQSSNYLFTESSSCINDLDIIPYAWHDIMGIPLLKYTNVQCPIELLLCAECITRFLILAGVLYIQLPLTLHLRSELESPQDFFLEAMRQHDYNTYLSLLGLPPCYSDAFSYHHDNVAMLSSSL